MSILTVTQVLKVEDISECEADVSYHYFSSSLEFPKVCYKCGGEGLANVQCYQSSEFSSFHAVCDKCKRLGHKPRTRKKKATKGNKMDDFREQESD